MEQFKKTRPFDRIDEGKQYLMKILEEKGFKQNGLFEKEYP